MGYPKMRAGNMKTGGEPPVCSGIAYGSYNGTKAIYSDGGSSYLKNTNFNYDNTVTGFTILAMIYGTALTWEDFSYYLSLHGSSGDITVTVGGTDVRIGNSNINQIESVVVQEPIFLALSYDPNYSLTEVKGNLAVNGIGKDDEPRTDFTHQNWTPALESNILKRVGGGNKTKGYFGFLQIIDKPISLLCCEQWTANAQPRNITGDFSDVVLLDFESIYDDSGTDSIQDLSGNGFHWSLEGFSADEKNPAHPDYCLKNIP